MMLAGKLKIIIFTLGIMEASNMLLLLDLIKKQLKDGKYEYEIGVYAGNYKGSKYTITIDFKDKSGDPQVDIACKPSKKFILKKQEYCE